MADSLPYYAWEEVAQHTTVANGVWVVIDGCVYNVTKFLDDVGALYLEPPQSGIYGLASLLTASWRGRNTAGECRSVPGWLAATAEITCSQSSSD